MQRPSGVRRARHWQQGLIVRVPGDRAEGQVPGAALDPSQPQALPARWPSEPGLPPLLAHDFCFFLPGLP